MACKPDKVDSLLECPICREGFSDPRVLPCLHTLCRRCLERHVAASGLEGTFKCPSCRHECQVPKEGLSAMPRNFFLHSFRELLENQSTKVTGEDETFGKSAPDCVRRECHIAKGSDTPHGEVTAFCDECAEFYCKSCELCHRKFGATKYHRMRPANEVGIAEVQSAEQMTKISSWEKHPTQHVDLYCDTCRVPVCRACCLLAHKQHEYRDLRTVEWESSKTLTNLDKITAVHAKKLDKHFKDLENAQEDIQKDVEKAHREINQVADKIVRLVNHRRQYLHQQTEDMGKSALAEVRAACKKTEVNKATLQSLQSNIWALQASGDIVDQVIRIPGLKKQLHQQQTVPLHAVRWTASFTKETKSIAALDEMLGTASLDKSTVAINAVGVNVDKSKCGTHLHTLNHKLGRHVQGMAIVGNVVCAVGWDQACLWLHDTRSGACKTHILDGLSAVGVTALDSSQARATLFVTDQKQKLHTVVIQKNNMEIMKYTRRRLPFLPRHIKVDATTRELVIANLTHGEIVICDYIGDIKSTIRVCHHTVNMWCAVVRADLRAVFGHSSASKIDWVDSQGRVIHTYGQGEGEGLCYPQDMVMDSLGRMVVTDSDNHRLHLIDANKQLSCYLLTKADGIRFPTAVCLSETTSSLYVACVDGISNQFVINVYTWPLSPLPTAGPTICIDHAMQVKLNDYT